MVNVVVFPSRDYLTATRVTDSQTVRVFLGKEWTRHQPGRRSTFTSGGRGRTVTGVEFSAPDGFSYRLKDEDRPRRVEFGAPMASRPAKSTARQSAIKANFRSVSASVALN